MIYPMLRLPYTAALLPLTLCMLSVVSAEHINPVTTLECHVRQYRYWISKPYVTQTGEVIPCGGYVTVNSCWGRCDSSEVGDFKMPYKQSHHPVCTYATKTTKTVRFDHCVGHPDPTFEVLDAVECACSECDQRDTSCENLNG